MPISTMNNSKITRDRSRQHA